MPFDEIMRLYFLWTKCRVQTFWCVVHFVEMYKLPFVVSLKNQERFGHISAVTEKHQLPLRRQCTLTKKPFDRSRYAKRAKTNYIEDTLVYDAKTSGPIIWSHSNLNVLKPASDVMFNTSLWWHFLSFRLSSTKFRARICSQRKSSLQPENASSIAEMSMDLTSM